MVISQKVFLDLAKLSLLQLMNGLYPKMSHFGTYAVGRPAKKGRNIGWMNTCVRLDDFNFFVGVWFHVSR